MTNMRKLKRAVIREELVALTGDPIEALILDQFISWTEYAHEYDKRMLEEKKRYKNEGKELGMELTHGWICKRIEDICKEIMFPMSKPTARKHMTSLIEKGYLDERSNPNPKQAKQYRANIKKIQNDLAAIGCSSADWTIAEES